MGLFDFVMKNVYGVDDGDRADNPKPVQEVTAFEVFGDRSYDIEVVGESHYQPALWRAAGGSQETGPSERFQRFLLWPEPDNPYDSGAIAVLAASSSEKVGHLSRDDAAEYRGAMIAATAKGGVIICDGKITWGGFDGSFLGCVLDLPDTDTTENQVKADK